MSLEPVVSRRHTTHPFFFFLNPPLLPFSCECHLLLSPPSITREGLPRDSKVSEGVREFFPYAGYSRRVMSLPWSHFYSNDDLNWSTTFDGKALHRRRRAIPTSTFRDAATRTKCSSAKLEKRGCKAHNKWPPAFPRS